MPDLLFEIIIVVYLLGIPIFYRLFRMEDETKHIADICAALWPIIIPGYLLFSGLFYIVMLFVSIWVFSTNLNSPFKS